MKKRLSISRSGISLLEVLAAIFVVSIGLLGVLAVIPFGAFQVSKARHAEYASNMLANAAEEIFIREMAKPESWGISEVLTSAGTPVFQKQNLPENPTLNCTKFLWIEPRTMIDPAQHIFCIGATFEPEEWQEWMRGQDDLDYTTYKDKRPDFAGQEGKIQSSGKYTWFFTFLPETETDTNPKTAVPLTEITSPVAVDVLACYNRVPSDDRQVEPSAFSPSRGGGTFTLPASYGELLSQTKYVFVTWEKTAELDGTWCKIVFLNKSEPPNPPELTMIVTGGLPNLNESNYSNRQVYIPSGVLYHKQLEGVPIR